MVASPATIVTLPSALMAAAKQVAAGNPSVVPLEERLELAKQGPTLIFDGVCNLCNHAMRWYYDRLRPDSAEVVYFMWAQHEDTQEMLKALGIRPHDIMTSWAYVSDQVVYRGSSAWFQAVRHLRQPWRSLAFLDTVPEVLREGAYGVIAKTRYRTIGRSDVCQRPAPGMRKRFLHAPDGRATEPNSMLEGAPNKDRLLVIGLGPAGLNVVKSLYKEYSIVAVEPRDYFEFTPGILRGLADPDQLGGLQVRYADALKGMDVQHIRGEVLRLYDSYAEVKLLSGTNGDGSPTEDEVMTVPFDYAVVAAGSQYASGGSWKVTAAEAREGGGTLEARGSQLLSLRHQLLELRGVEGTAVLLGAGLVGVELAAELVHYIPGLKVLLADASPVVLKSMPPAAQEYASKWLREHKVDLRLGQRLPRGGEAAALGVTGASLVLTCAGIKMRNSFAEPLGCLDEHGAVRVNRMMQVLTSQPASPNSPIVPGRTCGAGRIFALGDCVVVEGATPPLDKLTYPAEAMAEVVVSNLRRAKTVQCLRTCPGVLRSLRLPLNSPSICSLGPNDAIFVLNNRVRMKGWAAAKLKQVIETTKMGQYRQEAVGSLIWGVVPHF